jgi:hypothetical protein
MKLPDGEGTLALGARLLLARFACSSHVLCSALSPSSRTAAYATKGTVTISKLHVPQGSEQCRVSKVKVARRWSVRLLCWLTEDRLAVVATDNRVQVCTESEDTASLSQEMPCPQQQEEDHDGSSCRFDTDMLRHLHTGAMCLLPSHHHSGVRAFIPTLAPHSTLVVAYSDLALREYDATTGLITLFRQKVSPALQSLSNWRVVLGLSWDEAGDVICLHDQTNVLFMIKSSVLQHDWDSSSVTAAVEETQKRQGQGEQPHKLARSVQWGEQ